MISTTVNGFEIDAIEFDTDSHTQHVHQHEEALWHCDHCGAWWCSQPAVRSTRFMLELPVSLLAELGWDNFRGWRLGGTPHVSTCPDCGNVLSEPRLGAADVGPWYEPAG